jgi:hypothetical protein
MGIHFYAAANDKLLKEFALAGLVETTEAKKVRSGTGAPTVATAAFEQEMSSTTNGLGKRHLPFHQL